VAQPLVASSDVTSPPTLAIHGPDVAILWSQEHRAGLSAGAAELFSVSFPASAPALQTARAIFVPDNPDPEYTVVERYAPLEHVAAASEDAVWTAFVEMPVALPWSGAAQAVVANMMYDFRVNPRSQLVLLMLENGALASYQQPALTRQFSLHPVGAVSGDDLHLAWIDLEELGGYAVYYASTSPQVVAALDRRTPNDTFNDSLDVAWGMASGLTLLPLSIVAALPILVVCGIYYLSGLDGSLRGNRGAQFALFIAVVLYLATKFIIMGGLLERPPMMNAVPEQLRLGWTWVVAAALAAIAGVAMALYLRRARRPELLKAALLFFAVDALLTLLLYGPTFYGE
jgi:hypothetical protein